MSSDELKRVLMDVALCATCNLKYGVNDMKSAGRRGPYYFYTCQCRRCGSTGIGVVFYSTAQDPPVVVEDPNRLTANHVLDAHEFFEAHQEVTLESCGIK